MIFMAKVHTLLKRGVRDNQGIAVGHVLHSIFGYENVVEMRIGKFFEVEFESSSEDEARKIVIDMCKSNLCNTIIEDYTIEELKVKND
jgi:phosphoribosylformylglycinamidine synthase PurS subunit